MGAQKLISATVLRENEQAHVETPKGYVNISVNESGEVIVRGSQESAFFSFTIQTLIELLENQL